jgi:ketol-acid reductoisomerase
MRKLMVITVGVVIPGLLLVLVWKGYNAVFEANVNPELAPYELYVEPGTTLETVYE